MIDTDPSRIVFVSAANTSRTPMPSFLGQFVSSDAFSSFWLAPIELTVTDNVFKGESAIVFDHELGLSIPGLDAVKLMVGSSGSSAVFPIELTVKPNFELAIHDVTLALRFETSMFTPVRLNDQNGQFESDPTRPFLELALGTASLSLDLDGNLNFTLNQGIKLDSVMIGTSGIVIEADDVGVFFGGTAPPGQPPGTRGVSLSSVKVFLPGGTQVSMANAFIGNGGFSGEVTTTLSGEEKDIGGLKVSLTSVSIDIKQNALIAAALQGTVLLPYFDKRVNVDITLGLNGDFGIIVTGVAQGDGSFDDDSGLLSLSAGPLDFEIDRMSIERSAKTTIKFGGHVKPNLDGITFPSFEIKEASIDTDGHLTLAGGWVDLPNHVTLNLYGFTLEITKLGFGTEDNGDRWIGLSGALKIVDGVKAGASVKGLRITFKDDTSVPSLSLEGVGIDFEIPNAVTVSGSVSLVGQDFKGAVKVVVQPISLTVDGQFVTGKVPGTNQTYFGIVLHGELPVGIPLGATGLAIYGLAGLYGQNLAPGKKATEGWFENPDGSPGWYKRPNAGVDDIVNKWSPTSGAFAFGAGITLGTYSDNGYEFSGRVLLVLSFPGPTILIDGRANLFKKRTELSTGEPMFRALAVIEPGKSFLLGLDAHYKYKDDGELMDLKGSAEAFFDFSNAKNWHIFIGRKDPKLKRRIAARIFKLFDVNSYFELTPQMLQLGSGWSFDKSYGFSRLKVQVNASMQTDATISWHPNHLTGAVTLDGSASLRAFGHGVGVRAHTDIKGDVFDPFHLEGGFHVGIDLPWPLPDLGGTIRLKWQKSLDSTPPLPLPLREATVEHTKRMLKWPIPRNGKDGALLPDNNGSGDLELPGDAKLGDVPLATASVPASAPRVPADSKIGLAFSRPVKDDSDIGVNPTGADAEIIGVPNPADPKKPVGAYTVEYHLSSVALEKRVPAAESIKDLSDLGPRWVKVAEAHGAQNQPGQQQLFGAWAPTPPDASSPSANSEQLKLLVNAKTPFDYTSQQLQLWDSWIDSPDNAEYPCQPPALDPNQKFCANFIDASLPSEGNEIVFDNPEFSVSWSDGAELVDSDTEVPGGNGSRRSLGVVGTTAEDDQVLVTPPRGVNEVLVTVGTVQTNAHLIPTALGKGQLAGNTVTMPNVLLSVYSAADPTDDSVPGSGPAKTPTTATRNADGSLNVATTPDGFPDSSNMIEITLLGGAASALNLDIDIAVGTFKIIEGPGPAVPPMADLVSFRDTGERDVLHLHTPLPGETPIRQAFRMRRTGSRVARVTVEMVYPHFAMIHTVHARLPVSATAVSREGSDTFGPFEEVDGVITVVGDDLGLVKLDTAAPSEFTIMQLCTPDRRLELQRHTISSLDRLTEEDFIFDPQADYRMVVTTRRNDHAIAGNNDAAKVNEDIKITEQAYFHIVGPPGIEVPAKPATPPPSSGEGDSTGFEDLRFYVKSTVPDSTPASDGKPVIPRAFYRAYDVSIAFNEPSSVEKMYRLARRDLTLRLFDTGNNPVLDAAGNPVVPTTRWDTATQPTLTDAQNRWVQMVNAAACRPSDIPPFDETKAKTDQIVSAPIEMLLQPEALHQARLVPALLHEAFINAIPGLVADGHHELERWTAVNDDDTKPGRWFVDSADVLGTDGKALIGADGKNVKTFFATETKGVSTTLLYRGPIAAPPDQNAPGNWSDFRASFQFRWPTGTVALQVRYASSTSFISIGFVRDATLGPTRTVTSVDANGVTFLGRDFPDLGGSETDVVATVDCVGTRLRISQPGLEDLNLVLPSNAPTAGTVGFAASSAAGCRFTEIRVDDLRPNPATAQRFDFITSKYANFAHHLASFDDRVFEVPANLGVSGDTLTTKLPAAVAIPAGGPTGFGLAPPNEAEKRAFEELELASLGADGRLREPTAIEILQVSHDTTVTALLIRSPEPFQWERTLLAASVAPATPNLGIPGDIKMTAVSFGSTPATESVELLLRAGQNLTGFSLQWRHVVDANNADPTWASYFTFGTETMLAEGIAVLIFSGTITDAPPREPGTLQRFVAADSAAAVVVFPTDGTGVELRLLDPAGTVVHQREFKPASGSSQQIGVNVIRKADATALFLYLTPQPKGKRPPGMRLDLTFTRNLGATATVPILRQAGSETPEVAALELVIAGST